MVRVIARVVLLLPLIGCTATGDPVAARLYYGPETASGAGRHLVPFTTLAAYVRAAEGRGAELVRLATGQSQRDPLFPKPVAIAAAGDKVYVLDGLLRGLFRVSWQPRQVFLGDKAFEEGRTVDEVVSLRDMEEPTDVSLGPDGDIFIADKAGEVRRFTPDGRSKQVYASDEHLNQPVAVTVDRRGVRIFVADGLYDRVVVFNPAGRPLYAIGRRGEGAGELLNIQDMTQSHDGFLYVVDGVRPRVTVHGLDGSFLTSFGKSTFTQPGGIAVDDENRVFVSDTFNHQIVAFAGGKIREVFGGNGWDPGEFHQPAGLAYSNGFLFVADTGNARVQVLRVVAEAALQGERER